MRNEVTSMAIQLEIMSLIYERMQESFENKADFASLSSLLLSIYHIIFKQTNNCNIKAKW